MGSPPTAMHQMYAQSLNFNEQADAQQATQMRKGKWTKEESAYCDRLIEEFKNGNLPLTEGTTLRTFLSKLLNCDPMRISKKYTGDHCIGKIIFRRREDEISTEELENIRKELAQLERYYLDREHHNQKRRERRLESELSRDKNRLMAARSLRHSVEGQLPTTMDTTMTQYPSSSIPLPEQASMISPPGHPSYRIQQQQQQQQQPPHLHQNMIHPPQPGVSYVSPSNENKNLPPSSSRSNTSGVAVVKSENTSHSSIPPPVSHPLQPTSIAASNDLVKREASHEPFKAEKGVVSSAAISTSSTEMSFPRISSTDSFSALFPRVASLDNLDRYESEHQPHQQSVSSSYSGGICSVESSSNVSTQMSAVSTSSTSEGNGHLGARFPSFGNNLNSFFRRIESYEQFPSFLASQDSSSDSSANKSKQDNHEQLSKNEGSSTSSDEKRSQKTEEKDEATMNKGNDEEKEEKEEKKEKSSKLSSKESDTSSERSLPEKLNIPRNSSGIFPRVPSLDKLPRVPSMDKLTRVSSMDKLSRAPSMDKLPRVPSMDKLSRAPSMDKLPRVPSLDRLSRVPSIDGLSRFGSSDHLSSFPSFSSLSGMMPSSSYDKLSSLTNGMKGSFPRNSSIEDILSLVASSDSHYGFTPGGNSSTTTHSSEVDSGCQKRKAELSEPSGSAVREKRTKT